LTRIGVSRICSLIPVSDATPNNGVPMTPGSHYQMVDKLSDNTGNTYIKLYSYDYQIELFGISHLPFTKGAIEGVRVINVVQKEDSMVMSGACTIRSNDIYSNDITSNAQTISNISSVPGSIINQPVQQDLLSFQTSPILSSLTQITSIVETDPDTGSPWTINGVNMSNIGFTICVYIPTL
jgi:hypothetical protein